MSWLWPIFDIFVYDLRYKIGQPSYLQLKKSNLHRHQVGLVCLAIGIVINFL